MWTLVHTKNMGPLRESKGPLYKLLRNDNEKKVRFLMRQEKTLKPCGNFLITEKPSCELKPMPNIVNAKPVAT